MSNTIVGNLQLIINGVLVAYKPNSLKFTPNTAENKVVPLTVGGRFTQSYHCQDISEATSTIKFEVIATNQVLNWINFWHQNTGGNAIEISSWDGTVAYSFSDCSLVSIPELTTCVEDAFELEFKGSAI